MLIRLLQLKLNSTLDNQRTRIITLTILIYAAMC